MHNRPSIVNLPLIWIPKVHKAKGGKHGSIDEAVRNQSQEHCVRLQQLQDQEDLQDPTPEGGHHGYG
jgi:hypothetical protein